MKHKFNLVLFSCVLFIHLCFRYIQSTCATSGEGLYEGLDWLSSNIASKVIPSRFIMLSQFPVYELTIVTLFVSSLEEKQQFNSQHQVVFLLDRRIFLDIAILDCSTRFLASLIAKVYIEWL